MRKTYFIGILCTLVLLGIRIGFVFDQLSALWVIKEVLLTLLFAHIYLAIPIVGGIVDRQFLKSWVIEMNKSLTWLVIILFTLPMIYLYIIAVNHIDVPAFLLSGYPLFISGILMDKKSDSY